MQKFHITGKVNGKPLNDNLIANGWWELETILAKIKSDDQFSDNTEITITEVK